MSNKARILIFSLLAALPAYLWLEVSMPYVPPESLYGVAAGLGFVVGVILNFLWQRFTRK